MPFGLCCCFWTNLGIGLALLFPFLSTAIFFITSKFKKHECEDNDHVCS
jgi:hypothetical protein